MYISGNKIIESDYNYQCVFLFFCLKKWEQNNTTVLLMSSMIFCSKREYDHLPISKNPIIMLDIAFKLKSEWTVG